MERASSVHVEIKCGTAAAAAAAKLLQPCPTLCDTIEGSPLVYTLTVLCLDTYL